MTGFSRVHKTTELGTFVLELSSVNHRYQDIQVRLPKELYGWEIWFQQQLKAVFRRGKLNARVTFSPLMQKELAVIDGVRLQKYSLQLREIATTLGEEPPKIEALLSLPGVVENTFSEEKIADEGVIEQILLELFKEAVAKWQQMRSSEGAHLKDEIYSICDSLEDRIKKIDLQWAEARDIAFEVLQKRVSDVFRSVGGVVDQDRMHQELALITDRFDIAEELARFRSHYQKFMDSANEKDSVGRKLDFIVQEMNREINTIDSKVADASIRWLAIEAKAYLERIREQIQNLE